MFLLLIALLIILPTSLASDNEACEFTNCACRFFLDDDISRGLLIESCKACIKSANPYVCTGCLSWAGGLSLGCGTYTHATDDYYTGLNYCSAERVAFNLIEAGIDLLPGAIPTDEASLLLDIVEKATSEMNGWILDELKEEYATQEIDCREYINLPPLQFIDIETNPYGSEYIDVFDPGVPTPTEPFTFTTKVYNMGQRERLIDYFFVKFTL